MISGGVLLGAAQQAGNERMRERNGGLPESGPEVRWFRWWEVQEAFAYGRTGAIALHHFRYDLRRFGLGPRDPACHILSTDRASLVKFGARFGLREGWIEPPRRHRPDIWHFDAFGRVLDQLVEVYPLPAHVDEAHG